MGQPGRLGAGLGHVGHAGGVQLPEGPRVQPCFIIRQSDLTSCSMVYSLLSLSFSLVLTSPYRVLELISRVISVRDAGR